MLGNMGFLGFGVYQKKMGVLIIEYCLDWNYFVVLGQGKCVQLIYNVICGGKWQGRVQKLKGINFLK